jgi:signal transduction histidine kinase
MIVADLSDYFLADGWTTTSKTATMLQMKHFCRRNPPKQGGLAMLGIVHLALVLFCACRVALGADEAGEVIDKTLPLLQSVEEIRNLSSAQAGRGYPVRIRGVVTFQDSALKNFFIQDSKCGIYVAVSKSSAMLYPGQFAEVEGKTQSGNFAVSIQADSITVLEEGKMPSPLTVSYSQLASGMEDSQWVEVRGFVRSVERSSDGTISVDIINGESRLRAFTGKSTNDFSALIECAVRLQGVAGTIFNTKRQLIAPVLFFSSISNIVVESSQSEDPFAMPAKSVRQLFGYASSDPSGRRVKISGVVTGHLPDEGITIRDKRGDGLFVETRMPDVIGPGAAVEVVGFPGIGRFNPILQDAIVRRVGSGSVPIPILTDVETLLAGDSDADLVTVEANLMADWNGKRESFLTLQEKGITFNAVTINDQSKQAWPSLRDGCRLRITGICRVQEVASAGSWFHPCAIRLYLRSPDDIVVLSQPSWWTTTRLLWLLSGGMAFALLASIWGMLLKRRTIKQAKVIRNQVQREGELKERARIAREFHDTLEQELAGISLQLDMISDQLGNHLVADQIRVVRRLLRRCQDEAHRSVWDLRCGVFERGSFIAALKEAAEQAGRAAAVEICSDLPRESFRLPTMVEHHLLRISQEAVHNAIRHGRAKKIFLEFARDRGELRLLVRDDGCGFITKKSPKEMAGHFGLLGMRERAEKMGGSFGINSQLGAGTEIIVKVPEHAEIGSASSPDPGISDDLHDRSSDQLLPKNQRNRSLTK